MGGANVGVVGGDVKAKHVAGDLQVGHVGGDLEAREVEGAFKSGNIGGDLYLVGVEGAIQAISGGDTTLSVTFKPEQEYSVQAGSDLTCRVGPDASATLALIAGGDISLEVPAVQVERQRQPQERDARQRGRGGEPAGRQRPAVDQPGL